MEGESLKPNEVSSDLARFHPRFVLARAELLNYNMRNKLGLIFIVVLWIVALPACAFAWGPLTHMYLGTEVLYLGSLLPAGIYRLIKKFRQDFLYGNLMADTVLAKKYMEDEVHSHSW